MSLNLKNQAGAFSLFSIIYLLFQSMVVAVNCCGGGCFGGDGGGGGGGDGGNAGDWESTLGLGRARERGGGADRMVHTPGKAIVVEMATPQTQRIEMGYNGGMESAAGGGKENVIEKTRLGQNKQNKNKPMWSKIAQSLGVGGPAIGSNPAGHHGNGTMSPGRGRRR